MRREKNGINSVLPKKLAVVWHALSLRRACGFDTPFEDSGRATEPGFIEMIVKVHLDKETEG
jgi:hypothetical protein